MTEREQIFIQAFNNAAEIIETQPLDEEDTNDVRRMLAIWDELMPLLVADVVAAVRKELQNGQR